MIEAIKPTPGPWYTDEAQPGDSYRYVDFGRGENYGYICRLSLNGNVNTEHNARLIAEAGTVFHETQCTPRQLVERVKELEDTLDHMAKSMTRQLDLIAERAPGAFLDKQPVINTLRMHSQRAQKALYKSLPNTVAEVK